MTQWDGDDCGGCRYPKPACPQQGCLRTSPPAPVPGDDGAMTDDHPGPCSEHDAYEPTCPLCRLQDPEPEGGTLPFDKGGDLPGPAYRLSDGGYLITPSARALFGTEALDRLNQPAEPVAITADMIREGIDRTLAQQYEPTGLVLHPRDFDFVDCVEQVKAVPDPYRRANQMRIADAFGIPYWMAGVDGCKPPIRVRLRTARRRLVRRLTFAQWRADRRYAKAEREGWDW